MRRRRFYFTFRFTITFPCKSIAQFDVQKIANWTGDENEYEAFEKSRILAMEYSVDTLRQNNPNAKIEDSCAIVWHHITEDKQD